MFSSFMFDFELIRILGSASSGGCDVGKLKIAVGKIKKHDAESWHVAWKEEGERAERSGSATKPPKRASRCPRGTSVLHNDRQQKRSLMNHLIEPRIQDRKYLFLLTIEAEERVPEGKSD